MNHLVFLDAMTGELEKILSGTKTMLIKEFDPRKTAAHPVCAGDSLYFLRDKEDCALRVKATVIRVLSFTKPLNEDLSHILKEMQPRLQLTEDQYNYWSEKEQVLLVEFGTAQKISLIPLAAKKIKDRSVPGYLPQDFGVYPNLSAQEFLEHMAAIHQGYERRKSSKEDYRPAGSGQPARGCPQTAGWLFWRNAPARRHHPGAAQRSAAFDCGRADRGAGFGGAGGVVFVPTLALALGVISSGNRVFEVVYIIWWYMGPMSKNLGVDFTAGPPQVFLLAAAGLLLLAAFWRGRQVRV